MAILDAVLGFLSLVWGLFTDWLFLFVSPAYNLNVLWIIIPIWLAWFFGEFFQEKQGTTFGNAVSNGVIPLWVSIDWTRLLVNNLISEKISLSGEVWLKFILCAAVLLYGATIIYKGVKGSRVAQYIGRIREITYVMVVVTPVIYSIVDFSVGYFISIVLFFPVFYFFIEFIDQRAPNPKVFDIDQRSGRGGL